MAEGRPVHCLGWRLTTGKGHTWVVGLIPLGELIEGNQWMFLSHLSPSLLQLSKHVLK